MTISELRSLFQVDYNSALITFYNENRDKFLSWAGHRFSLDKDALLDVYQDAILVLYNMIIDGKIKDDTHDPESYLHGIAKNLALKELKNSRGVHFDSLLTIENVITESYIDEFEQYSHTSQSILAAMDKLKGNCKDILVLFYYRRYKLEAIKHHLNLLNESVVKSRKSQCLKELKRIIGSKSNII